MLIHRPSSARGHFDHGWLKTWHSFSFADYYDPQHMGFQQLRVINDDTIAPGGGFGMHGHRDMEIITYVLSGELAHRDSMGNSRTIREGEVQAMSAGTGVRHSEFNASSEKPVHLLQIWIEPQALNVVPGYAEWRPTQAQHNQWVLAVSGDGEADSLIIHQDARMYIGIFDQETKAPLPFAAGRKYWLQMAKGTAHLADKALLEGDGVSFAAEDAPEFTAEAGSTALLFDLK